MGGHAQLDAEDITITAGENTYSEESTSSTKTVSASVSTTAPTSVNGSLSNSDTVASASGTTYTNSFISAGSLGSTSDNMTIAGATVMTEGDLDIDTNNLVIKSLQDTHQSSSETTGGSVGDGSSSKIPSSVGATNLGNNLEQTTLATLGAGSITKKDGTAHDTSGVNTDLNNTQEVTLVQQTGWLDATVTVDQRVFSENGQDAIKKDFIDTSLHIGEIGQSIKDVATTDQSALDFFGNVNGYATERKVLAQQAMDKKAQEKLRGDKGSEGSEEGLQELSDALSDAQGLEQGADIALYDGSQITDDTVAIDNTVVNKTDVEGAYHEKENGIYVNIDNTDMTNSTEAVSTLVHEQNRHQMAQEGDTGSLSRDDQTTLAGNHGDRAGTVWDTWLFTDLGDEGNI